MISLMTPNFDHVKLEVYRESIAVCAWVGEFLPSLPSKISPRDQLDRASTSIPLNIAEGDGKFSARDRARFLEMARGSALECAACLDVLVARKLANADHVGEAKGQLAGIVRMLMGLLKRFSERADVLKEEEGAYAHQQDQEQDQDQEQEGKG
jgi:four helix bundle protein